MLVILLFWRIKMGFMNVLYVAPQTSNPYVMWSNIKVLYSITKIFLETNLFYIQKSNYCLLKILHTLLMFFVQVKFPSIQIPRKDVDSK